MPRFVARSQLVARSFTTKMKKGGEWSHARNYHDWQKKISSVRGRPPLVMLWLACVFACEWTEGVKGGKSPLELALWAARANTPVVAPDAPRKTSKKVRRLFFLIRNSTVRDPEAPVVKEAKQQKVNLLEVLDRQWAVQDALHEGAEPFSTTVTDQAAKAYREALANQGNPNAIAFLNEVKGHIWRQLHL